MTQLELKLANSNSDSCTAIHRAQYSSSFLTRFSSAVCWWWSHTAHARMTVFCQPSSIYLNLKYLTNWTAHCELLMWLTELNRSVYSVENLGRRWRWFFSRVLHNENHVLHPQPLPARNDMDGYELRRRRHERGLTMPNAISFTDSYINIGLATNFSNSHLSVV